jgi:hypothetical protein
MPKLNERDVGFLKLVVRSPSDADGWRSVSKMVWPLVVEFPHSDLIEVDATEGALRVRLTDEGKTVTEYLT